MAFLAAITSRDHSWAVLNAASVAFAVLMFHEVADSFVVVVTVGGLTPGVAWPRSENPRAQIYVGVLVSSRPTSEA